MNKPLCLENWNVSCAVDHLVSLPAPILCFACCKWSEIEAWKGLGKKSSLVSMSSYTCSALQILQLSVFGRALPMKASYPFRPYPSLLSFLCLHWHHSHDEISSFFRRAKALVNKVVEDAGGATSMPVRPILACPRSVCIYVCVRVCVCARMFACPFLCVVGCVYAYFVCPCPYVHIMMYISLSCGQFLCTHCFMVRTTQDTTWWENTCFY